MEDFEKEIRNSFLEEAATLLEETESAFISLETAADPSKDIDNIFRMAHSFKGSAKAVGFEGLAHLAHVMEDALNVIKHNKLIVTPFMTTVLLSTVDVLRDFIAGLKNDGNFQYDTVAIIEDLRKIKISSELENKTEEPQESKIQEETLHHPTTDSGFEMDSILNSLPDSSPSSNTPQVVPVAVVSSESSLPPSMPAASNEVAQGAGSGSDSKSGANKSTEDESIRISVKKLDTLLNYVGEMVVQKSILDQAVKTGQAQMSELVDIFSYLSKLVGEVQTVSTSLRMVPIKPLFHRLQRTLRDIANIQGKEISLITQGDDVELDKMILDRIIDPLTHVIRNAVDHGIEDKEEREKVGKKDKSTIWLMAVQEDNIVKIIVKDNGRGLNREKIVAKAIKAGLIRSDENMTEKDVFGLIFQPGFSTKEVVTDISGRGFGMDVVLKTVQELKGSVDINSTLGKGSEFTINIPLSHAILGGFIILVDETKYIIPLPHLVETIRFNRINVHSTKNGERVINLRGEIIPVFNLSQALNIKTHRGGDSNKTSYEQGIIVSFENQKSCFEIDSIFGQQEVVIKKIGKEIGTLNGIIGAGIIGSGEVSLILNLKDFSLKGARYGYTAAA